MPYPSTFEGYASPSLKRATDVERFKFEPKTWSDDDVDIEILFCGLCGSDLHKINGSWNYTPVFPLVVGHEVAGIARKVGSNVKDVQVGDIVGCGAQIGSCKTCRSCTAGHENYCLDGFIDTYDCHWPDGTRTHGGYSNYIRADGHFVFKIPEEIPAEEAAPMLCGGLTVYAPLSQNGCGPGVKVGIAGIGGLGHYAIQFAAAMGAEVWAISHSPRKKQDALELGASHFVDASKKNWEAPLRQTLDLIVSTSNCDENFPLKQYLSMLAPLGKFMTVGMPDKNLPPIHATDFLANGCTLGATHIGNRAEALAMLDLAAQKGIRSWIQREPLTAPSVKKALEAVRDGNARYRWVFDVKAGDIGAEGVNGVNSTNGVNGTHAVNGAKVVNGTNGIH